MSYRGFGLDIFSRRHSFILYDTRPCVSSGKYAIFGCFMAVFIPFYKEKQNVSLHLCFSVLCKLKQTRKPVCPSLAYMFCTVGTNKRASGSDAF